MNILIVRVSSLGDVVHNMPLVADILRHHPDATIDWVVEEAYTGLVALNANVRHIIPFALRRWRRSLFSADTRREISNFIHTLRSQAYDVVLDTQGLLKTGAVIGLARVTPGGRKVGLANGTEGSGYEAISRIFHDLSVPVDVRTHAVQRGRLVAAAALAYQADGPAQFGMHAPDVHPAWMPEQPYAVFFHGTARDAKKWAPANWIAIGNMLAEQGMPVLLSWGNDKEKQEAGELAAAMPNARVLPRLSILEAAALAESASLAIGVDTGLTHIAAAYERPTIELYCDSPRWKTEGNWSPNIINLGDAGQPPQVEQVWQAVRQLQARHPFPSQTDTAMTGRAPSL